MSRGIADAAGLSYALAFGAVLGAMAVLTQSVWLPALVGSLTYLVVILRDQGVIRF